MPLLDEFMTTCVFLTKERTDDGYGGYGTVWKEGVSFKAAIVFDSSIEARVGEVQGVTSLYTVTTQKSLTLEYHEVFKRVSDGKVFRVTSDGDDRFTPESANLDMRQVTAEEFVLTA